MLQGYQNCILRVYRNSLNEKNSRKNVLGFSYFFSEFEQKIFGFLSFLFEGVVKSVFYVSMGTLRRKLFFKKFFTVSLLFRSLTGKKFSFPASFFRQVWKNCISGLNRYILRRGFQKKVLYVIFGQQSKTFGCRNSFLRVPRNTLM